MSNQGMGKECKFCGAKFGQGVKLCPNCGSTDIKLIVQENMDFLEAVSGESEKTKQPGAEKKKPKKKWKKVIVILVSVLVGIFVLLIVAFLLLIRWADKAVEKEKLSISEQVEQVLDDSEMSDAEWKEAMLPLLDDLYSFHMDEEIAEVFDEAVYDNRPIYDWDHYLYASYLSDFYVVNGIWGYEQAGASLKDYHNTEILYYCLEFRTFEHHEGITAEEKERLQQYVMHLHKDAEERWNFTEEDLDNIYAKATEEYGYLDYFAVERFLKESEDTKQEEIEPIEEIKPIENIEEALKATEGLYGVEWQKAMRPILNQLYEQNEYRMLYDIYVDVKSQDTNKPIAHWEHYLYIRALYDIYDIEKVLELETAGEQIKEWQYVNILMDYFSFEDFENRSNLTEEEKEKLMPLVITLREDAKSRWNLSEKEWEELHKNVLSEYNVVQYEEVEEFVEFWMEKNGYANDDITIEAEMVASIDLDDDTWKKRFFPKLDEIYEQGADEELYNAVKYGRTLIIMKWHHKDYVDMLSEYYKTERVWNYEQEGRELDQYDYTTLLHAYLLFEHWETNKKSLSEDEKEKLKPYREKILKDGESRWDFSEDEWAQINDSIKSNGGYVRYYEISEFINQWLENN